jgi:hypothetical protein
MQRNLFVRGEVIGRVMSPTALHNEMDQRKEEALGLLSQSLPTGEYETLERHTLSKKVRPSNGHCLNIHFHHAIDIFRQSVLIFCEAHSAMP